MIAAALVLAAPALAQTCGPADAVARHLSEKYGETRRGAGVANAGVVIELYVAPNGRTWTLVAVRPNGTSCLIASGDWWHAIRPEKGKPL